MVRGKKKTKTCGKGSQEDWISKLPDALISDILVHLPTKDAVRTNVLSTRWRNLWLCVPGLDLDSSAFSNLDAFVSFGERFLESCRVSLIRKVRLWIRYYSDSNSFLSSWMDVLTKRRIQHLDLHFDIFYRDNLVPQRIYTCETLVHLRLEGAVLPNAEFISLPCLKIMHLERMWDFKEPTLEKLISASPVLEDLTIIRLCREKVVQVHSNTLKRTHIDQSIQVVIDAPLLQCLRTEMYSTKNFTIINSGFPVKLDIDVVLRHRHAILTESFICDIITDISRVRDLVITSVLMKNISESRPLLQFRDLSRLNAKLSKSDLEKLPTILESCPKLESFILELVKDPSHKKNIEPNVMFSTVPLCMVSSLKYVGLKRLIPRYEGEIELVRYFLKNSTILEKLKLDTYYTKKAMCAFLKEVVEMPRCSSACQVLVL